MDDAPRTGGLQAFFLVLGGIAAFVAEVDLAGGDEHAALAVLIAVVAFGLVGWLEVHARRRRRAEREDEERRRTAAAIAHLDFD